MKILPEVVSDFDGIAELLEEAFARPQEARLVEALRKAGKLAVGLVGLDHGLLAGYVALSPVEAPGPLRAAGLGPVAVLPRRQKRGFGAALVARGVDAARAAGFGAVFVLGEPAWYAKSGFVPAGAHGFKCEYDVPSGFFLVKELVPGALAGRSGTVRYASEFAACV